MKPAQARRKGVEAESAVQSFFHDAGYICERIPSGPAEDRGDLVLVVGGVRFCVQVKHYADTNRAISEGEAELPAQVAACRADHGMVVQRPKGKPNPADYRAVFTLAELAALLSRLSTH